MRKCVLLLVFLLFLAGHAVCSQPRVIHVFVALCDNANQGIVPVPMHLGRGDHPASNLYWGAAFGVRTYFRNHPDWQEIDSSKGPRSEILERVVFRHRKEDVFVVADAYNGAAIRQAIIDFLEAAAGDPATPVSTTYKGQEVRLGVGGAAGMVAFVGHNGLMDFSLNSFPLKVTHATQRDAVVLACASKPYFQQALQQTGARPLLWTTGLLAPEAYTLAATIDGWMLRESPLQIRTRAAQAYCKYQKCSLQAGMRLFASN